MTWRRAASFDHSGVHGEPDAEFARDDAPAATSGSETTDACKHRYEAGKISEPDA